ncbi:cation acetate symporter [Streptomyces sp. NPDC051320]|uniref:sodium/solute symporter n=1 Tax=Streptomyces sp. NPDC051320 TaxID=3154644 RepID=UPI00341D5312
MNQTSSATQSLVIVVMPLFIFLCLMLCVLGAPEGDRAAEFYTGNRVIKAWQSGFAIAGEYFTVLALLGTTSVIVLDGFDGVMLALGRLTGLAVLMALLAEPLRNAGCYTMGDALARRFPGRAVRIVMGMMVLAVCLPYLVLQLSGLGDTTAYLLGLSGAGAQTALIAGLGGLMVCFATCGGMRATVLVQILKIGLLITTMAVITVMVLSRFDWNINGLLDAAERHSGFGAAFLRPDRQFGSGPTSALDLFGLHFTGVLGVAGLPHLTMHLNTARNARSGRSSMRWAVGLVTALTVMVVVVGMGIAAIVGAQPLRQADASGVSGIPMLASALDGSGLLLTAVSCAVFVTALAGVAGVTFAAASSVAHDIYTQVVHRGHLAERSEVTVARWSAAVVGTLGVTLAAVTAQVNLNFMLVLGLSFAASALTPVLLYGLLWKGFTKIGALWCMCGSSALVVLLTIFSPQMSGSPGAIFPDQDFNWFPLQTPGLVTIPVGFGLGWLASVLDRRRRGVPAEDGQYDELELIVLTGKAADV